MFNRIDRERLSRIAQRLSETVKRDVATELAFGRPGSEIVRLATERNASIVVMGTQGRSAAGEWLLGSVSHYIARHSPVPTLLIPKP